MLILVFAFLIAVVWEVAYARKHGLKVYDFSATISHLNLGAGQTAINALTAAATVAAYVFLYERFRTFEIDAGSPWLVPVLVVVADFCYYWAHRASHRVNFFVAAHVVHHQAEDFNHGSSLRQSWTSRPAMFLFYAPLAFVGVPVKPLLAALLINLFLQFFSHNGVIRRKLGFLEHVLVTPRLHRVHHGTNAPYLDKNFSGIFIFWDALFGTRQELREDVPVRIGPIDGINLFDPVESNLNYYRRILFVAGRRRGLFRKLSVWFETPESLEADLARFGYRESSPRPRRLPAYGREAKLAIVASFLVTIGALVAFMANKDFLPTSTKTALTIAVLAGAWITGRIVLNPSLIPSAKRVRR